jgi:hypothetical protein
MCCRYEFVIDFEEGDDTNLSRHALQFRGSDAVSLCISFLEYDDDTASFKVSMCGIPSRMAVPHHTEAHVHLLDYRLYICMCRLNTDIVYVLIVV